MAKGEDKEASSQGAQRWLDALDMEFCVQLGMLADSAEEVLRLARFLDNESFEIAQMPAELSGYSRRVKVLFDQGHVLREGTYTAEMITHLSRPRLLHTGGAHALPRTLGSVHGVPNCH